MKERKKTRIRRKNMGIKKLILFFILIFIIIQLIKVIVPASITFSRYVYSAIRSYYLNSQEFYFKSDKLAKDTAFFEASNWSGVDEYKITINMNSRRNNIEASKVDIDYKVSYEYDVFKSDGTKYDNSKDLIDFTISKTVAEDGFVYGTILTSANNKDYFDIIVKPKINVNLLDNDYVFIKVTAESLSPYKETLTGEFKISIGNLGMSYKIEDENYSPYLEVIVTNTLDYYVVDTAFGSYQVGSNLTILEYNALTEAEKQNCHSMIVTLSFDPTVVVVDTTANMYLVADQNGDVGSTTKNNFTYINKMSFRMDAEESKVVKFYKINAAENYTYPFNNNSPVVTVTYT